ncbi:hypothetical protein Syun_006679 [Stephania yunnanensis]|uniref:Uncharacterized protein n=1 Tax=Stephania yunnanensis TaxID=152371 RepID=A0AAP0KYH7_9MAGN
MWVIYSLMTFKCEFSIGNPHTNNNHNLEQVKIVDVKGEIPADFPVGVYIRNGK